MIIKGRNKVKVVLIVTDYSGFLNFLSDTAAALIERGFIVHLICSKIEVIKKEDDFKYNDHKDFFRYDVSLPRGFNVFKLALASLKIRGLLGIIRPTIVHMHFTSSIFCSLLFMPNKFYTIGTFHGLNSNGSNNEIGRYFWRLIEYYSFFRLNNIDVLNTKDLLSIPKVFKKKSFIHSSIGVGCRLSLFNQNRFSQAFRRKLKNQLDISEKDFVLLFVGRFTPFKGFNELIGVMDRLKNYSDIKLILVGGFDQLHPVPNFILDKMRVMNSNIINVGFQSHPERFFSIADLFVFPSFREGLPVVVMESLSMGVPVITLTSRGCDDLIENGFNGFKIDHQLNSCLIVKQLSCYIKKLHDNPPLLNQLKDNSISRRTNYSRKRFVKSQLDLYSTLVKQL